jgi:hypothetical protein
MSSTMSRAQFKQNLDPSPEVLAMKAYISKLEAENATLKSQQGTDIRLFDHVKDAIKGLDAPARVKYDKPTLKHDDLHAVLVVTDAHAEEFVSLEEMEGLASYNWSTFEKRMRVTTTKTVELTHIMRMPVAVPRVGMEFALMLKSLSAHFDKVRVFGMCGNHGREGKKPVTKMTADRNWDMSVYLISQALTQDLKNVEWNIPRSIMAVADVGGWNCLLTHSGEVNMNNRTPYYPIETTFDQEHKSRTGTDKDFTYAFTGHWHHHAVLDSTIIMCPSMIGNNQYSRFKLHRNSTPEQLLAFFTEKRGLINQWPIKLADIN